MHNYTNGEEKPKSLRSDPLFVEAQERLDNLKVSKPAKELLTLKGTEELLSAFFKDLEEVEWTPGNTTYRLTLSPIMANDLATSIAKTLKKVVVVREMSTLLFGDKPTAESIKEVAKMMSDAEHGRFPFN